VLYLDLDLDSRTESRCPLLHPVLASKGYLYEYHEYHEGTVGNWRAHLDTR